MKPNTARLIWENTLQIARDLVSDIDEEMIQLTNLKVHENSKTIVIAEYDKIKKKLKKDYYYKGESIDNRICHHKVASCFCNALIRKKIIHYDVSNMRSIHFSSNDDKKILFINYKLAFFSGVDIVHNFLQDYYLTTDELSDDEKNFSLSFLNKMGVLEYPPVNTSHDSFIDGVIKMIGLQDTNGDEFDVLGFSYIYYFIEYYNKTKIKNEYLSSKTP